GIVVTNVPDYCVEEVAEHALALIFALGRKVAAYHAATKGGTYDLKAQLPVERISGKTLGVVGLGRIGVRLAELGQALGMRVVGTNRSRRVPPGVAWATLDELLEVSDFVSLQVPLTDATRLLINQDALKRMKPSAFLINTSRGGLVDHAALAESLVQGKIAGAGLDVQTPEPPQLGDPPYCDPRVIVTPHVAFQSSEATAELRMRVARQTAAYLGGQSPENVVNPTVLA
ncbi:MAG: NAD(P)-dependent oxidoreductase, partial [Planctomycetota bacterium]